MELEASTKYFFVEKPAKGLLFNLREMKPQKTKKKRVVFFYLVVEPTHLKNMCQIGSSFPQRFGVKIKIFETTT